MDLERRCFANLGGKQLAKSMHVVREGRRFVAGAGDGDVIKAGAEKVGMDPGVGMDQDSFGGKSLCAVAGDGIAVVEEYGSKTLHLGCPRPMRREGM